MTSTMADQDKPAAAAAPSSPDRQRDTEETKSARVSLADVCAKGAAHYAHRRYEEAAGCYARAAEMQAELDGEMEPANAEVLFLYGRSLFRVGQGKSDVLGGRAGGGEKKKEERVRKSAGGAAGGSSKAATAAAGGGEQKKGEVEGKPEEAVAGENKPLFQFTGDENWDESDEEEVDDEDEEEDEDEEDDDLAVAFEVLDLARVLFVRRLEQLEAPGEDEHAEPSIRHVKERLADTHDLLSEISLENERYLAAITDGRASLAYKKALYPPESELIAEAHYKLSLALEFASITTADTGDGGEGKKAESIDQAQRDEACAELQAAIDSTRLKLRAKEAELEGSAAEDEDDIMRGQVDEVKEIIADMEQRLSDLRGPPIDINETLYGAQGLLGSAAGASASKLQEAKRNATDLSSLVRRKEKPKEEEGEGEAASNGKRKAGGEEEGGENGAKKAKVEDAP